MKMAPIAELDQKQLGVIKELKETYLRNAGFFPDYYDLRNNPDFKGVVVLKPVLLTGEDADNARRERATEAKPVGGQA